ncbi:hypothetical protein WA158_004323 [Blastocystis sp. Blastoise]
MSICQKCYCEGNFLCEPILQHQWRKSILLTCEDKEVSTTVEFIHILNYLQKYPNQSVIVIRNKIDKDIVNFQIPQQYESEREQYFSRIKIKYIDDCKQLNIFLLGINSVYSFGMIVIDNFDSFFMNINSPLDEWMKTISFLTDAVLFEEKYNKNSVHSVVCINSITDTNCRSFSAFINQWFVGSIHVARVSQTEYVLNPLMVLPPIKHPHNTIQLTIEKDFVQVESINI